MLHLELDKKKTGFSLSEGLRHGPKTSCPCSALSYLSEPYTQLKQYQVWFCSMNDSGRWHTGQTLDVAGAEAVFTATASGKLE